VEFASQVPAGSGFAAWELASRFGLDQRADHGSVNISACRLLQLPVMSSGCWFGQQHGGDQILIGLEVHGENTGVQVHYRCTYFIPALEQRASRAGLLVATPQCDGSSKQGQAESLCSLDGFTPDNKLTGLVMRWTMVGSGVHVLAEMVMQMRLWVQTSWLSTIRLPL
jgi:hypothetical protein